MKKFRVLPLFIAGVISAAALTGCAESEEKGKMRDISTMELVRDMEIGINLGNTFESCGSWIDSSAVQNYETGWGSPVITKEMIKGYADEGFGVLRVPVAWSNMMAEDYTINPDYLKRVREVVDMAIGNDMYVIMNIHWDGGWWEKFPTEKEECMKKYTRIWEQLSEEFKSYSDYLMFESLNEEGCWNDVWNRWNGDAGKDEAFGLLNEINQKFVDIVRSSGGNNKKRHLLIAGYATDVELTCDDAFDMPEDDAGRCAVSVHYYTPSTFCILEEDADWGKAQAYWGSPTDRAELEKYMDMLEETFISNEIPVIIGEYGVATGNKTDEVVRDYISSVCDEAYSRQICPVLWDVTDAHYSRTECKMKDQQLLEMMMAVKEAEE